MRTQRMKKLYSRFLKETTGNVAIIASLAVIPMITVAGVAVDFQRVITKKNTVQHTLDAAIIAAARERQAGRSENEIRSFVTQQFEALLLANDPSLSCTIPSVAFDPESEAIDAAVSCSQPTTLSGIIGVQQLDFTVNTASTYGIGQVDVAFVFDLSGSMNSSGRLSALKQAADDAITALLPEDSVNTGDVRLGISTYNHSVNAGSFFEAVTDNDRRPSNLERSEDVGEDYGEEIVGIVQIDSFNNRRFFDYETVRCDDGPNNDCDDYTDWSGRAYFDSTCVYNRTGTEAFTDAAPGHDAYIFAGQPIWDYRDNENETNRPADFSAKRNGQREVDQRRGQFRDGNPDTASGVQTSTRSGSSQSRGSLTRSIRFGNSINDNFAIEGCRQNNEPVPLTSNAGELRSFIQNMTAGGGTAGHLGIAWGWYLLSPEWGDVWPNGSTPLPYDEPDTAKALIIMTDGEFNAVFPRDYFPEGVPANSDRSTKIAAQYCDNIKGSTNITVFTVGFSVPNNVSKVSGTNQTILEYCASGPQFTFEADNAQELRDAYAQIASQISDLRLAR
ncbi:MAG: pilus assembly protein [Pseudomonadota bacterium]